MRKRMPRINNLAQVPPAVRDRTSYTRAVDFQSLLLAVVWYCLRLSYKAGRMWPCNTLSLKPFSPLLPKSDYPTPPWVSQLVTLSFFSLWLPLSISWYSYLFWRVVSPSPLLFISRRVDGELNHTITFGICWVINLKRNCTGRETLQGGQ